MGQYLKAFSSRVTDVPGYLRRHLALIRDLDEKVVALQQEIDVNSKHKLAASEAKTPQNKRQRANDGRQSTYDVESAITRLLSLADEKVHIAAQVYDFIDKHIQRLDDDLASLAHDIEADKAVLGLKDHEIACEQMGVVVHEQVRKGRKQSKAQAGDKLLEDNPPKKRKQKKKNELELEEVVLQAQPPGDIEPLYCYCQRPSAGLMVGCDNDECQYEWFHYDCVGLQGAPAEGVKWYCPDCAKIMQSKANEPGASRRK